jgi:hypothetical protein
MVIGRVFGVVSVAGISVDVFSTVAGCLSASRALAAFAVGPVASKASNQAIDFGNRAASDLGGYDCCIGGRVVV